MLELLYYIEESLLKCFIWMSNLISINIQH